MHLILPALARLEPSDAFLLLSFFNFVTSRSGTVELLSKCNGLQIEHALLDMCNELKTEKRCQRFAFPSSRTEFSAAESLHAV